MIMQERQVGINLRYLRECDGLSVEVMAKKIHMEPEMLQAVEAGDPLAAIPLRTIASIYNLYGINPEQLFQPLYFIAADKLLKRK